MFLGDGQSLDLAVSRNQRLQIKTTGDAHFPPRPVSDENTTFDHENDIALAPTQRDGFANPAKPRVHKPLGKERHCQGSDSLAIEESLEARLERLGRQRPEIFDSIWAEIGFVFSISMSQVLSV